MIIKKFQAGTETEAMILAKEELGKDAIVMNIKTIKPKGFYGLFRKPSVEVTAAIDDNVNYNSSLEKAKMQQTPAPIVNPNILVEEQEMESAIEKRLNDLQKLLENQLVKNEESKEIPEEIVEAKEEDAKP